MIYKEGAIITSKKPHACGGKQWTILRVGADIKLKCSTCGRVIFLSKDDTDKMVKTYSEV